MKRLIIISVTSLIIILAVVINFCITSFVSTTTVWDFRNPNFKDLGTITNTTTIDDLTLEAKPSKTMIVKANRVTVDSIPYTHCLSLSGAGNSSYRAIKIPVKGKSDINIIADAPAIRTLVLAKSIGTTIGTAAASATASKLTYKYTGDSGFLYLYSSNSNINIYRIEIESSGGSFLSFSNSSAGADAYGAPNASGISTTTSSTTWSFDDENFKNLGTITKSSTINDLTLYATNSQYMKIKENSVTVDSEEYNYCLSLEGEGSTYYRSLEVPVSDDSTLKVIANSETDSTLAICDSDGNKLSEFYPSTTAQQFSYDYKGSSNSLYLMSEDTNINIYKIQVDSPSNSTRNGSFGPSSGSSSSGTKVFEAKASSFTSLVNAISSAENAGGGTIYVTAGIIECPSQIPLSKTNSKVNIIGVMNADGSYPILDFTTFRQSYIGKTTYDSQVGIRITGSYYTIKNLIIENAPDNGIQIKGREANNNLVSNCITRYNNDAGLQITNGAHSNNIQYVYSYRNCDVYTLGGNADGFAPKLGAGANNKFYYCYSWDNSDDGWDSYDKSGDLTPSITYENCACWHNGDPNTFTGKWDFDQGNALDTNLLMVQLIIKKSANFKTDYENGSYSIPSGSFIVTNAGTLSVSNWISNYEGNSNGFKFGSAYTSSSCIRTIKNCLAFDHTKKGFDNNNSSCTASFNNCVAFDNGYNYFIAPFKITSWNQVIGFNGLNTDKLPSGYLTSILDSIDEDAIRNKVNITKNNIINSCKANIIPTNIEFDIFN